MSNVSVPLDSVSKQTPLNRIILNNKNLRAPLALQRWQTGYSLPVPMLYRLTIKVCRKVFTLFL